MNQARLFSTTGNLEEALNHAKVLSYRCFAPLMHASHRLVRVCTARRHIYVPCSERHASSAVSTYSMLVESDVHRGLHSIMA
jgi:hypothetical protein